MPWNWTHNVGGGDFFRLFDAEGSRVFPGRMRTAYHRQGPCLTEVTYAGRTGSAVEHSATVSLGRTDDVVRGTYRLRMDVKQGDGLFATGAVSDRGRHVQLHGRAEDGRGQRDGPDARVEHAVGRRHLSHGAHGVHGPRALDLPARRRVACERRSRLARPHKRARSLGQPRHRHPLVECPPGRQDAAGRGSPNAVCELVARIPRRSTCSRRPASRVWNPATSSKPRSSTSSCPSSPSDYYGPNKSLRAALGQWENTWRMIHREATGNDRRVEVATGTLQQSVSRRAHPGG